MYCLYLHSFLFNFFEENSTSNTFIKQKRRVIKNVSEFCIFSCLFLFWHHHKFCYFLYLVSVFTCPCYFLTTQSLPISLKNKWHERQSFSAYCIFSCLFLFWHHFNICLFVLHLISVRMTYVYTTLTIYSLNKYFPKRTIFLSIFVRCLTIQLTTRVLGLIFLG